MKRATAESLTVAVIMLTTAGTITTLVAMADLVLSGRFSVTASPEDVKINFAFTGIGMGLIMAGIVLLVIWFLVEAHLWAARGAMQATRRALEAWRRRRAQRRSVGRERPSWWWWAIIREYIASRRDKKRQEEYAKWWDRWWDSHR